MRTGIWPADSSKETTTTLQLRIPASTALLHDFGTRLWHIGGGFAPRNDVDVVVPCSIPPNAADPNGFRHFIIAVSEPQYQCKHRPKTRQDKTPDTS